MNKFHTKALAALIPISLAACSERPDWVRVQKPIANTDNHLWYEPSSIRKIGEEKAIVNVKWTNKSGLETFKGVMNFNCQKRLFITTNTWTNSDGNGFKPYVPEIEIGETQVIPNGPIESIMDAACN